MAIIRCLYVGDGWKDAFDVVALGDRRQQRSDAESDSRRDGVNVQPEGYPRGEHEQHARQEALRKVIAQLPREDELHAQTAKVACKHSRFPFENNTFVDFYF